MKSLNTMKFISNAIEDLCNYVNAIKQAETYEHATYIGGKTLGYIDAHITFLNSMICEENNDFTQEYDEVVDRWIVKVYQAVLEKAIETKQSEETIDRLIKKKNQYTR